MNALAALLVAALALQSVVYEYTVEAQIRDPACGEGSWVTSGTALVEVVEANDTLVVLRVKANATTQAEPPTARLTMCASILESTVGFGDGFTYRFPADARYPDAPPYYNPGGGTLRLQGEGYVLEAEGGPLAERGLLVIEKGGITLRLEFTAARSEPDGQAQAGGEGEEGGWGGWWLLLAPAAAVAGAAYVMAMRRRGS